MKEMDNLIQKLKSLFRYKRADKKETAYFKEFDHDQICASVHECIEKIIGERIKIEDIHGLHDAGVDLIIDDNESKVGLQVKSYNDIASSDNFFSGTVKRQIQDSKKHSLEHLFILLCGDTNDRSQNAKINGLKSEISQMNDNYISVIPPEYLIQLVKNPKAISLYQKEIHLPAQKLNTAELITKFQSRYIPLSQCIAETYSLAKRTKNGDLIALCEGELTGWSTEKIQKINPTHRLVQVYTSFGKELNMEYFGWGQNSSTILNYLRNNPEEFTEMKMIFSQSIAKLEAEAPSDYSPNRILSIRMKAKDFVSNFKEPDFPVYVYAHVNSYRDLFEAIRTEFTKRLMDL